MSLLPSIASSNIADLFTKPLSLSRHRFTTTTLIGDLHSPTPTTSVVKATVVPTVDSLTVAVDPTSASVPTTLPIVLDTGASFTSSPSKSDFLPVTQAPYGLFRSAASLVSDPKVTSVVSSFEATSVDPYTLITGEDVSVSVDSDPVDLSSPDLDSDSGPSFIKVHFDVREFGTASLTFIFSPNWSLIKVFVTPTQVDWIHWVPLPRLILPESYFHIFGLDYLQAYTLFHLTPIWIYYLLHFAVNLED